MPDQFSAKEIYNLMDKMRSEITEHILRLETKFDALEAGRVSRLEKEVAQLTATLEPIRNVVYGIVAIVLVAVLSAMIYLVIKNPQL